MDSENAGKRRTSPEFSVVTGPCCCALGGG